jgi:hypothetical protein
LSADCTIGAGAVSAAIHATVSGAVSVYLASAVISGKRAGNAGGVQDQSHSCHEQDQCNYWKFFHYLSSTFVSTLTLRTYRLAFSIYISLSDHHKLSDSIIYSGGSIHLPFEVEK